MGYEAAYWKERVAVVWVLWATEPCVDLLKADHLWRTGQGSSRPEDWLVIKSLG